MHGAVIVKIAAWGLSGIVCLHSTHVGKCVCGKSAQSFKNKYWIPKSTLNILFNNPTRQTKELEPWLHFVPILMICSRLIEHTFECAARPGKAFVASGLSHKTCMHHFKVRLQRCSCWQRACTPAISQYYFSEFAATFQQHHRSRVTLVLRHTP